MTGSKPTLNLDDLTVETIGVVPSTMDHLSQGHGMTELAASCNIGVCEGCALPCVWGFSCTICRYGSDESGEV